MEKIFSQKGFTLVEMLIVVAIIAILASVFLVGLQGFRGTAYDSRRLSDLQKVQSYLELYYNQNRAYPEAATWADLGTKLNGANIGVTTIPNDPLGGAGINHYYYMYDPSSLPQRYILAALFSDPKSKTVLDEAGVVGLDFSGFTGEKAPSACGTEYSGRGVYCAFAQ
jgi:prepilin-type N-terminal cleavage/methylation domain-containing protein